MKASDHFQARLREGVRACADKYGAEEVRGARPWSVYFVIHDALVDGHQHNAKINLGGVDPAWSAEAKELKDAHIETAIKAAVRTELP